MTYERLRKVEANDERQSWLKSRGYTVERVELMYILYKFYFKDGNYRGGWTLPVGEETPLEHIKQHHEMRMEQGRKHEL